MPGFDVFNSDPYTMQSLTDAINKFPPRPQRIAIQGLFEERGITTTSLSVEELTEILNLIPAVPRGAPAYQNISPLRNLRPLRVPHLPVEDRIGAAQIQDVREFGTESALQTVETIVNARQEQLAMQLDMTLEYHRINCLKGKVLDADGVTVLYDLYTEFGVTPPTEADHNLDTAAVGALRTTFHGIARTMGDSLGMMPPGIGAFVGSEYFDALVEHAETRSAYERWSGGLAMSVAGTAGGGPGDMLRMGMARRSFFYAGIFFEEYSELFGSSTQRAVGATKAHFFPIGVPGLYVTRFAPGDFIEAVNTVGLPRYSKLVRDPEDRWVKILAESNPINLCTRPEVLLPARKT